MRVLIAADKFKGSLTAPEACAAIADGVRDALPGATIDACPMSDGGEGFVDAMLGATGGRRVTRRVTGPLPEMRVDATFGVIDGEQPGDTAVIEMSAASGLALLATADRNPLYTTTFGTGELIRFAVEMECRRVLLGIGGSATCDAGLGCLQACGCHVILRSGEYASMTEPLCGRDLDDVLMVKARRGSRVDGVELTIACDVANPLHGPDGAARVFGPQKGASPDDARRLDQMLASLADRLGWQAAAARAGSGAAGGLGCGLTAVLGARLTSGVELVIDAVRLRDQIAAADLVIIGEGRLDATSADKVIGGVARACRALVKPCVAIVGTVDREVDATAFGLSRILSLVDASTTAEVALAGAASFLRERTALIVRDVTA